MDANIHTLLLECHFGAVVVSDKYIRYNAECFPQLNNDQIRVSDLRVAPLHLDQLYYHGIDNLKSALYVYNHTNATISTCDRHGIRQSIKPIDNFYRGYVVLRHVTVLSQNSVNDFLEYLSTNPERAMVKETEFNNIRYIMKHYNKEAPHTRNIVLVNDVYVDETELRKNHTVYVSNRDLCLSFKPVMEMAHHPHDRVRWTYTYNMRKIVSVAGSGFALDIVDNSRNSNAYWMLVGTEPIQFISKHDPERHSGVYLSLIDGDKTTETYYTLEDACKKFLLFPSRELALTGGNIKAIKEIELEEKKFATQQIKLEYERDKALSEKARLELEKELATLKNEYTKREAEYKDKIQRTAAELEEKKAEYAKEDMRRKEEYERKSQQRKNTSEILKIIPVLITAGLGLLAYMSKKT